MGITEGEAWLCHHSEVGAGVGFVLLVFWEIRVSRPGELAGAAVRLAMSAVVPCGVRGTGGAGVEVAVGVKCDMVCLLEVSN